MPLHPETPPPPFGLLVTGSYRQKARFSTYRKHGTRDWLLIYNLSGTGRYAHLTGDLITQPGDIILLKPYTRHDYGTALGHAHWEPLWAHFVPKPDWLGQLDWPEVAPGILCLRLKDHEQHPKIVRRYRDMLRINATPSPLREALAMNALEEILLRCSLANPKHAAAHVDSRIRHALDFIGTNFAQPLTLSQIARECGLSLSRFAHLFRDETGETPQRYLEIQRLLRARQLLEFTQEPIRLIAEQVGFENPFYFTLRFKRHSSISPREWRQRAITGRMP